MRLFSKKRSQSWMRLWLPHYVERSLDLGHQRVLSPGLSKLGEVFRHRLGPGFIVGEQIGLVRFVYGAGLCAPVEIHERMGAIDLCSQIAWLKRERSLTGGKRLVGLTCQQCLPASSANSSAVFLPGFPADFASSPSTRAAICAFSANASA